MRMHANLASFHANLTQNIVAESTRVLSKRLGKHIKESDNVLEINKNNKT